MSPTTLTEWAPPGAGSRPAPPEVAVEVVDDVAHAVELHRGAAADVVARPSGIAGGGEPHPRSVHRVGDRGPLGTVTEEDLRTGCVERLEHERDFDAVARAEHPAEGRRGPVEAVQPRGRPKGGARLGDPNGGKPEAVVAGDRRGELSRLEVRSSVAVGGDEYGRGVTRVAAGDGQQPVGVERRGPPIEGGEQIELVPVGAEHERYVGT